MPQDLSSEKKLEHFLTDLARNDVSASSQNQAFNAILFFYQQVLEQSLGNVKALRARRPAHERHAPTVGETQLLLQTIRNAGGYPTNLISRMLGCGLREGVGPIIMTFRLTRCLRRVVFQTCPDL
jgi:hypothetical protein